MSAITYDEVNLMLRLYDLRREQKLRQARSWYLDHFHLDSPDEMMEKYKAGSDEYNYIRMVPTWRAAYKNPLVFCNLEEACKRLEAWREKRAPGSNAAMRQMMEQARA